MTSLELMELLAIKRQKDKEMKIDSEGWMNWRGGECPVNPDYIVQYQYRGMFDSAPAKDINWNYCFKYRVVGVIGGSDKPRKPEVQTKTKSDGSTASYYELPAGATELQHLISHKNMNAQIGEIFRSCYRYGAASHSDQLRDAKKIKFYIEAEIERLEKAK